jgi:diguanylate cyclase (GGDEF)-like protein
MMQVEFERAERHRYPLVCMVIGVDEFEELVEVYGPERKSAVMQAGFGLLKREVKACGLQGIGCWTGDRLLAVLPHSSKKLASDLAQRLVEGARTLYFDRGGHRQHISFSIGVARNHHEDTQDLEGLIRSAEHGYAMASEAGGDRYVHWKEVEDEIEKIRTELGAQISQMRQETQNLEETAADESPTAGEQLLLMRLKEVFSSEDCETPELTELEATVLEMVAEGLREVRSAVIADHMAEHAMQVQMLEKRISKLNKTLGTTAEALKRVSAMKQVDDGIASIYRDVQGIGGSDDLADQKKELMSDIFKANLDLKKKISGAGSTAA